MRRRTLLRAVMLSIVVYLLGVVTTPLVLMAIYARPQDVSRWQQYRYAGNPLFGGAQAASAYEPNVIAEGDLLKMWYTGGWDKPALHYATSADGVTWQQRGAVLGQGASGYAGSVAHTGFVADGGEYYVYFQSAAGDLMRASSRDGVNWTQPVVSIAFHRYTWATYWNNSHVWRDGDTWHMVIEITTPQKLYDLATATSADGLDWAFNAPLSGVRPGATGTASGPYVLRRGGVWWMWYHGTSTPDVLPTDLYLASSTDLQHWTIANAGKPVLVHAGRDPEYDQVADPVVVEFKGKVYLYFEGVNNPASASWIQVLVFDGTLADMLDSG